MPAGGKLRVVLGVAAGIAAYKACELLRLLTEAGYDVRVVPTADALRFVGQATWAALSGHPVANDVWTDAHDVAHVRAGQEADLVLVAPASADLLAAAAQGRASDLLTATLLTARCPVVFAPAMHTEMWGHPATQANVATLRSRGALVLDPTAGRLAGSDTGPGRLPDPAELREVAVRVLDRGAAGLRPDLAGRRVLVTAGGTREYLDPVRFLSNRSSGRQGYALARAAAARGAETAVVGANVWLPAPAGVAVSEVTSAAEMRTAVLDGAEWADAVVMAAAVADFRPAQPGGLKISKTAGYPEEPLTLARTPDILTEICADRRRRAQVIVGFAAETQPREEDLRAVGRDKLARKGCDLLVVNRVGAGVGFDSPDNAAVVLASDGSVTEVPRGRKEALADVVWDLVAARMPGEAPGAGQPAG